MQNQNQGDYDIELIGTDHGGKEKDCIIRNLPLAFLYVLDIVIYP